MTAVVECRRIKLERESINKATPFTRVEGESEKEEKEEEEDEDEDEDEVCDWRAAVASEINLLAKSSKL